MTASALRLTEKPDDQDADVALLRGVANGDMRAYRILHKRHHARIYGFALRIVQSPDRAEEIANDTWLAVWRSAHRFEGRSAVTTWLFGIAYRTALKTRRRFLFERKHVDIDDAHDLADRTATGAEAVMLARDVAKALKTLSVELRTVVELTYRYGYTYAEIGHLVGCPEGTVKSRMSMARKKLKTSLEAHSR
ncbi:MAG: sigma-70 family RNA polymerase sigma factor [Pseudomonadota bacterium]